MPDEQTTYSQSCSMKPGDVVNVSGMISSLFPQIGITVNQDRDTYPPSVAQQIPEGELLVTFEIPREGIPMVHFYQEFTKALQPPESTAAVQKERVSKILEFFPSFFNRI